MDGLHPEIDNDCGESQSIEKSAIASGEQYSLKTLGY